MKKVFVSKSDGVAEVVEKIIGEPESEVILVIPRETILDDSVSNFHLLKREAAAANKNIIIESVDEEILALAKASRIEAIHPLFKKKKSSSLSDIVPMSSEEATETVKTRKTKFSSLPSSPKVGMEKSSSPAVTKERKISRELEVKKYHFPSRRATLIVIISLLLIGGGLYILNSFRQAEIVINFSTAPFNYTGEITASASASKIDLTAKTLPAETFTEPKNLTETYPASSRKNVSLKATGQIVVYNAFSSESQALVAQTRFSTPDGKIYRLTNGIVVPGAKIVDGKISPSSIEATVTADQPGAQFNSGPIEKLSIPGFKNSPKYSKFYGSLVQATGGFIGEKLVPIEKDIASAKDKTTRDLKAAFSSDLLNQKSAGFKILDGAKEVKITKISVNKNTDEKGNFSVSGEVEFRAIGFKEEDLKSLLLNLATKENPNSIFKEIQIDFKDVKANFDKSQLSFNVFVSSVLTAAFDQDSFKTQILGQDISAVRSSIKNLEGLSDAKVSIWPSWLSQLPKDPQRIKITVN
ncbi:MAG: hypothetical protein HY093_00980 [Candidatus Liptonbacteria bacterium]|nr:hypothetical protein [Candidatus Liptonbacteria bacterium]